MSKELEALLEIHHVVCVLQNEINQKEQLLGSNTTFDVLEQINKDVELLKKALERLESIDNANPSEALECLKRIDKEYSTITDEDFIICYTTIKQVLLKAQEQEKEKLLELEQALIQGENNRIKLEKSEKIISRLIDKKSKKEIALDIIKKKCFNNDNLAILSDFDDYPRYISHFELSVGPKAILGYHVKEEDLLDENEYNILVEFFKNDKKGESAA